MWHNYDGVILMVLMMLDRGVKYVTEAHMVVVVLPLMKKREKNTKKKKPHEEVIFTFLFLY